MVVFFSVLVLLQLLLLYIFEIFNLQLCLRMVFCNLQHFQIFFCFSSRFVLIKKYEFHHCHMLHICRMAYTFLNPFFLLLYSVKTSYLTKGWTQIIKNNLAFARFTFSLLLFPSIYIYIYICICFVLILNFSFVFCFDNKHKNLLLARSFLLSKFSFHMIFVVSRFSAHVFPFCIFIYV